MVIKMFIVLFLLGSFSNSIAGEEENCAMVDSNNYRIDFNCVIYKNIAYKAGLVFDFPFYRGNQQLTWDLDNVQAIQYPLNRNKCSNVNHQMDIDVSCARLGNDYLSVLLTANKYEDGSFYWELNSSTNQNASEENIVVYSPLNVLIKTKENLFNFKGLYTNSLTNAFDPNYGSGILKTPDVAITYTMGKNLRYNTSHTTAVIYRGLEKITIDTTKSVENNGKSTIYYTARKYNDGTMISDEKFEILADTLNSTQREKNNCESIVNAKTNNKIDSVLIIFCDAFGNIYFDQASSLLPSGILRDANEIIVDTSTNILSKIFNLYSVSKNNENENTEVLEIGDIQSSRKPIWYFDYVASGSPYNKRFSQFESKANAFIELSRRHTKNTKLDFWRTEPNTIRTINKGEEYYSESCEARYTDSKFCLNFYKQESDGTVSAITTQEFHNLNPSVRVPEITTRTPPLISADNSDETNTDNNTNGQTYDWSYSCPGNYTGNSNYGGGTAPIPVGSCESEYKQFGKVFGCNLIDKMYSACANLYNCLDETEYAQKCIAYKR